MAGLIDYGITKPELAGSFGAGYAQAEQTRQTQQANQMKLDQLKSDREAMIQLQSQLKAAGHDPDLNKVFDALIATGNPDYVMKGIEGKQRLKDQIEFAKISGFDMNAPAGAPAQAPAPVAPIAPKAGALGSGTFGITPEAPVNALAPTAPQRPAMNAMVSAAPAPAAPVNALAAGPDQAKIAQVTTQIKRLMDFARTASPQMATQAMSQARILQDQLELYSKRGQNEPADALMMQRLGYPLTPAGYQAYRDAQRQERMLSPEEEAQRIRISAASRAPAQPRPEQPPVAVVDPATGKQVYVTREEALKGRMTPAAAMESLPPKEIQKREAALPQATASVKGFEAKSDSFLRDLKALRDHPGLNQITGAIFGRTGSVSKEGSAAQALYDKVMAKGGFQALQDLREASKTGGALGNVSNQEGKQLTASFAAIDRRQAAEDVQAAIDQAIGDIEGAKTRMREAYDQTYSYKSNSPAPSPVSSAKINLSTLSDADLLKQLTGKP